MPVHLIVVCAIVIFIFVKILSGDRQYVSDSHAKKSRPSKEPVYRKTLDNIHLKPVPTLNNSDFTPMPPPDIAPTVTPSFEYNKDWAYPNEILPVNTIHRSGTPEAFEAELNARYKVAQQKHQAAISSIRYPVITQIDTSIVYTLSPAERLFLWYINKKPVSNPKIGIYWRLDYGIYDFQSCIVKLMKAGLLIVSDDPRTYLNRLTIKDLKALGDAHGVSCSGVKQNIIDTLLQEVPEEELSRLASKQATFKITESGERLIKESYGLVFFHRNKNMYIAGLALPEVDKILRRSPSKHPYDALSGCCVMPHYRAKKFIKEPRLF